MTVCLPECFTDWLTIHTATTPDPSKPDSTPIRLLSLYSKCCYCFCRCIFYVYLVSFSALPGASAYTLPFGQNYVSAGPSFTDPDRSDYSGMYNKQSAENGIRKANPSSIVVSGLAGDWCVLDTAINAAALFPVRLTD